MRQPRSLPNVYRLKIFFTHRLSNKPFLIWLLAPYVAALPCNLSLMACFADINVSQGSVATYATCVGFLVSVELQIYQRIFQ